eukprot:SAG31_NODE_15106_length_770_cov_2.371088_1_plen_36_part_01
MYLSHRYMYMYLIVHVTYIRALPARKLLFIIYYITA